jgi:hypothetical protein
LINLSKEVSENSQLSPQELLQLNEFITQMDLKITELDRLLSLVVSQANEIATFFGEETETPINQIFGLFSEFISSFTKSKEHLEKKILIERRKATTAMRVSATQVLRKKDNC